MARKLLDLLSRISSIQRSRFRLRCNILDLCRAMLYHQVSGKSIFSFPSNENLWCPSHWIKQLKTLRANLVHLEHETLALFLILSLVNLFNVDHYEIISHHLDICLKSDFPPKFPSNSGQRFFSRYHCIVLYELPQSRYIR